MALNYWQRCFTRIFLRYLRTCVINSLLYTKLRRPLYQHETKICPRCAQPFECRVQDVAHCQCYAVAVTAQGRAAMAEKYTDCLCPGCIKAMQAPVALPGTNE